MNTPSSRAERSFDWFAYRFDRDKYIPALAAISTFYLKGYEFELRSALDGESLEVKEWLLGKVVSDSGELALADGGVEKTRVLRLEVREDEDRTYRKMLKRLETGEDTDLNENWNASIYLNSGDDSCGEVAEWGLSVFLPKAMFSALKEAVLSAQIRDVVIGLKGSEMLTNAYNLHYCESRNLNWFLPSDGAGRPISAECTLQLFVFSSGMHNPPSPLAHEPLEESDSADDPYPETISNLVNLTELVTRQCVLLEQQSQLLRKFLFVMAGLVVISFGIHFLAD